MSNSHPNAVLINVMGKEYQIACTEEQEDALTKAALYLDGQMRQIRDSGKVVGMERMAVMAALNITHEMQNQDNEGGLSREAADERVKRLNQKLDATLHKMKQMEI